VTLFASGDSRTRARLVAGSPTSLRLDAGCVDQLAHHIRMLELVVKSAAEFDLIHYHVDYLHYPISRRLGIPHVTTLHGRLDIPDLQPLYREFGDVPVVSISENQRAPLPDANWQATVYHGLPEDEFPFRERPGDYVAFLGRISPEKRVDRAIEIALRARVPLKIAAKVDEADRAYFEREIAPLLRQPGIEYVGEIGQHEKSDFLGNARALLFPIDWPEPFGLVMIEAMACGTPVIAVPMGSVPEIVEPGVSGFLVGSLEEALSALESIDRIDRRRCRMAFEERFSARRMAADYLRVYERLLESARFRTPPREAAR
jgi:glycosyltransferase involved in cell wall biosynthesis